MKNTDGRSEFMRDAYGVVHQLYLWASGDYYGWSWPTGHVSAGARLAEPAPADSVVTCLACVREHEKIPEYVRTQMLALRQRVMR